MAVKHIDKPSVNLTREQLIELNTVSEVSLLTGVEEFFYGRCSASPVFCFVIVLVSSRDTIILI